MLKDQRISRLISIVEQVQPDLSQHCQAGDISLTGTSWSADEQIFRRAKRNISATRLHTVKALDLAKRGSGPLRQSCYWDDLDRIVRVGFESDGRNVILTSSFF